MIRLSDLVGLAWRKLAARRMTTFFSIVAVSLGVALVTTFASLIAPIRMLVTRATVLFAPVRPDVVVVRGRVDKQKDENSPVRARWRPQSPQLTEADRRAFAAMPHVRAVCDPVGLSNVSFGLPRNYSYSNQSVWGVPPAFMERFWHSSVKKSDLTSAIPLVVGNHKLNVLFDEAAKVFRLDPNFDAAAHIGREVTITVGDNYLVNGPFTSDWKDGSFVYRRLTDDEYKKEKLRQYNNLACQYDMLIYDKTLSLKGVIVGFHHLERCLIPEDVARDMQKWLALRASLSSLEERGKSQHNRSSTSTAQKPMTTDVDDDARKRYDSLRLLIDTEANVAVVAEELRRREFRLRTRDSLLRETLVAFDRGAMIARRVSYAIGAILLLSAGMLVWLIIGKSVMDSRREIGLLRAVGATKRTILHIFIVEAGLLGMLGGLLGLFEGWCLARSVSTFGLWFANSNLHKLAAGGQIYRAQELLPQSLHSFDPEAGVAMVVVTIAIACLAGVVPALRAARLDPVEALRNE